MLSKIKRTAERAEVDSEAHYLLLTSYSLLKFTKKK